MSGSYPLSGSDTRFLTGPPSEGFFYVLHKGGARKIDFTNPRKVTDTPATDLPAEFRDEVQRQLDIAGVPAESQAEVFEQPATPAATSDRDAVNAVRTAAAPGRFELGDGVQLVIRRTAADELLKYEQAGRPAAFMGTIVFPGPEPEAARGPSPYEIVVEEVFAFAWEPAAKKLWVTDISAGARQIIWMNLGPGADQTRPGPQKVMVRAFDFTDPFNVKVTHITTSENGGDWSWGKIVPAAFHQPVLDALGERGKRLRDFIEPQKVDIPPGAAAPKLPKLPDDAYAKPGVHCQKFREEDAKRPGGELMGGALEPSMPVDSDKEPLVLGVRTASDAQWRIGGTAKVGLVVRNRTGGIGRNPPGSDVKFSYTGRLDNGLSVVAVDEAGKEHGATIAAFDGEFAFQHMLLPVAHVATIKEFTIRFDTEKRGVSEPRVVAFHLPPGKYKLRCKWNDARPEVALEGEWTGELVNEECEFNLAAAVAAGQERAPGVGEIVLHAIDVDTNKPIPNVTFVKENALRKNWATLVGKSDADGTVRIETKPLPGYFFSILPVPQGYKVTSLDEVPAQVKVGGRVDYRFHLRKRGANLDFLKEVREPKPVGNRFADALKDSNKDVFQVVIHDMPGFRDKPVTISFGCKNALLAERIFANGELVRAAVHDELRYFQKAEGKLAGDISELSDIKIVNMTVPRDPATSWYLYCRTKDGIELKQDGFTIRFEDLDYWDLEIPAFLHPEF